MIYAREAAIKVLLQIQNEGAFSNKVLQEYSKLEMSREDRRLLRELVYGVLENQLYIDEIIKSASNIKMKKIHPMILQILRVGIYQIQFMDRIPARAAINEAVNSAKKYGHKGTVGFVNGILRKIDREKDKYTLSDNPESKDELGKRYSHPAFLIDLWSSEYGFEFTRELVKANNETPVLNIRVNTLKIDRESLISLLVDQGLIVTKGKYATDCLKVSNPESITELKAFKEGLFTIQDESSMLVTEVASPNKGDLVIDVCSAPGGKATHMAQWMQNEGKIIARDQYPQKINLIIENSSRLGINIIEGQVQDALVFDHTFKDKADVCLVDAPCSGFGLIRRKPDIKLNRTENDTKSLVKIQKEILRTSAGYVKPGGVLIYSTCTLNRDENINQVKGFMADNPQFTLTPIEFKDHKLISQTQKEGYFEIYPHVHGTDGFFIAKMTRKCST